MHETQKVSMSELPSNHQEGGIGIGTRRTFGPPLAIGSVSNYTANIQNLQFRSIDVQNEKLKRKVLLEMDENNYGFK